MPHWTWVKQLFYLIAWPITLAVVERLNPRRFRARDYARLACVSTPFWLGYEVLNVRLANWEYWGIVREPWIRWPCYALAFATVLPAVLRVAALLQGPEPEDAPWEELPEEWLRWSEDAGLILLVLVLAWPRVFFPLAWAPAFLLLEPWVARNSPQRSWLSALAAGRARPALALLGSGLICGLLWELFNYWAGGKWKYTVPWPKGPKLFEMPWLGYLGFPPFALGCGSFWSFFEENWREAAPWAKTAGACGLFLFSLAAFAAIDRYTVHSFIRLLP